MQFVNGHIFVDGRFVPGGFSVEDGRFARVLGEAAEAPSVDLGGAYVIPGLVDIRVNIDALPSSNADLMLDTTFETAEALKGYSTHPAHVAVANSKVRPYYKNRVCLDYEI